MDIFGISLGVFGILKDPLEILEIFCGMFQDFYPYFGILMDLWEIF